MRKSLILAAIAAISLSATAQLKVVSNGQSRIGTPENIFNTGNQITGGQQTLSGIGDYGGPLVSHVAPDSLAPLCVMGLDIDGSWPRISFGRYNNVSIGEGEHATNKRLGNGILSLKANNGIKFESLGLKIFADNRPTGKEVIDALEQCGYASIQGHGTPLSIATSGIHHEYLVDYAWEDRYIQPVRATDPKLKGLRKEYKNSFDELRNYGKPSFIYSVACSSCPFDNLEENNYKTLDDYIMPTAFLFAGDFGGIAYIGYTRDSYFDSMYKPENKFSGILNLTGNLAYAFNNSPSTSKYMAFARSLIGDPELNIWMGSPDESSAKISIDNSEITVSDNNLSGSSVVIYNGVESKRFKPGIAINYIDIPFDEIKNMASNDFAVSIFKSQCLPATCLFADGSKLSSVSKRYFLCEGLINKVNLYSGINSGIGSNVNKDVIPSSNFGYIISDNGALHLTCTRFIKTDKYFKVDSQGFLEINCFGPASFSADEILKNGKMNVKATEIELQPGFSVQ